MAVTSNIFIGDPALEKYTQLLVGYVDQIEASTTKTVTDTLADISTKLNKIFGATQQTNALLYSVDAVKKQILDAVSSVGYEYPYEDIADVTWSEIRLAISRIPTGTFAVNRDPLDVHYPLPKCYQSWGDNVAYAYDYAMQFQETIDNNGGIHSMYVDDRVFKGFYCVEYSLDAIGYSNTTYDYYFTVYGPKSTVTTGNPFGSKYPTAYMVNITNADGSFRMVEFKDDESTTSLEIHMKLSELPQNGKLFLFGLYEEDQYDALIRVSDCGKCLLLGGHPKSVTLSSAARFDEGIIQMFKTGEPFNTELPKTVRDALVTNPDRLYICIDDWEDDEEYAKMGFTGTVVHDDDTTESYTVTFTYDTTTRWWYVLFPNDVVKIKNFSIYDRTYDADTKASTKFIKGEDNKGQYLQTEQVINLGNSKQTIVYRWESTTGVAFYTDRPPYLIADSDNMYAATTIADMLAQKGEDNYDDLVDAMLSEGFDDSVAHIDYTHPDDSTESQYRIIKKEAGTVDYPITIDADGYDIDIEEGADQHPGTKYYLNAPNTNQIYTRQSKGTFELYNTGRTDKLHMPEFMTHEYVVGGISDQFITISDSDMYEVELPVLEEIKSSQNYKKTTGANMRFGISYSCGKLHELTLPKLKKSNGIIARSCGNIYLINCPLLEEVYAPLAYDCGKLNKLHLGNLKTIDTTSLVYGGSFKSIKFDNLESMKLEGGDAFIGSKFLNHVEFGKEVNIEDGGVSDVLFKTDYGTTLEANFENGLTLTGGGNYSIVASSSKLEKYKGTGQNVIALRSTANTGTFYSCAELKEIDLSSVTDITASGNLVYGCGKLTTLKLGPLAATSGNIGFNGCTNLIHLELGQNSDCDLYLTSWDPTDAYNYSVSTLLEVPSVSDYVGNNLDQFLWNFHKLIVLKLKTRPADNHGKLYLSAGVKNYIGDKSSGSEPYSYSHPVYPSGVEGRTFYEMIKQDLEYAGWDIVNMDWYDEE